MRPRAPTFFIVSICFAGAAMGAPAMSASRPALIQPTDLRCEYVVDPLGIDSPRPRVSWVLQATRAGERGQRQSAYQVCASSSPEQLADRRGDLWNSGRVLSPAALGIAYGGKALQSGQRVHWSVRVWDGAGRPSAWSPPAWWEMGLLQPHDWQGKWIRHPRPLPSTEREFYADNPAPLLRRQFRVRGEVSRARAYVTGLGYYELRLNGRKVGDRVLDPGWTTYSKRVLYSTYDLTDILRQGDNAVGIMLGSGWYDPLPLPLFGRFNLREHLPVGSPRAILQLEIDYADGTREHVVTDESWKAGDGPLLRNSVYLGEVYDARREQPGWDNPAFDDTAWKPVVIAHERVGPLQAQDCPPIRIGRTITPARYSEPKPGVYIWDLGENFAGWASLRVRGPSGTRVTLRYGELLYADGTLNPMTSVAGQIKGRNRSAAVGAPETAWQADTFILKGEGEETYRPRFSFRGFRYLEVTGYPGTPDPGAVRGYALHSAVEPAGSFRCSNVMFNQLQEVVRRTLLSNLFSVQSDCPHREKLGYGGDIVATSDMAMLNFDMARFYAKTVRDYADAVRPNGGFTETAPFVGIADAGLGDGAGPVGWGTAHPLLVWQLYEYYGDRRLLDEQYEAAARWLRLLRSQAKDGILDNGISDHESLVPKPVPLTGTAFYHQNARLLARMAGVLGRREDQTEYEALAESIKAAFNRRFLKPGTGRYFTETQACQAFALFHGLVPEPEKPAALQALVDDVMQKHSGHLTTGIFGTKYLLDTLTRNGRPDVAHAVASQETFPGWGFMLASGATTLWEHWAFSDNTYSHNHPMFGSISEWFFRALAGIEQEEGSVAWERIVIRPRPVRPLWWATGSYRSVRGEIRSRWVRQGKTFRLTVAIPVNARATVHVPARAPSAVLENGKPASKSPGVRFVGMEEGAAVFEVGSGQYAFESSN